MQHAEVESRASSRGAPGARAGEPIGEANGHDAPHAWRQQLLQGLLTVSLITLSISAPLGLLQTQGYRSLPTLVLTLTLYTSVAVATFARRAPYVLRTLAMLAALTALSMIGFLRVGFLVGPGVGCALLVVITGLLLGQRAMWIAFVLTLGTMGGFAWLHNQPNDFLELPHVDPRQLPNWLREIAMYGLLSAVLAVSVTFVVRRIERALDERTAALLALRAEQAQRQETESALDKAHGALEQMQQLEVVGRLAGCIAHDFNNALVVVLGWADALRRMEDPARRNFALDKIVAAGSRAARLTHQLLAAGRKAVSVPVAVAPGALIDEFVPLRGARPAREHSPRGRGGRRHAGDLRRPRADAPRALESVSQRARCDARRR